MKWIQPIILAVLCGIFVSCTQWGSKENHRLMQQAQLLKAQQPRIALMV
jgi:hypothetical protein